MSRIFLALSLFAVALLAANIVLGLLIGDYNGAARQYQTTLAQLDEAVKANSASPDAVERLREQMDRAAETFQRAKSRQRAHFMFGVFAALIAVLVNCLSVTYFIGTARWCQEVADAYQLRPELPQRSRSLKRRTFPWSAAGIMSVLAIVFLGAACDPGGPMQNAQIWVVPHLIASLVGAAVIGWAFFVQVGSIGANFEIIEQIMNEVRRIQAQRSADKTQV